MLNTRALWTSTAIGTVLQIAMVVVGHTNPAIANLFAVGGVTLSLVAGFLYTRMSRDRAGLGAAAGGAVAGGACALLGIIVSYFLGDVPPLILVVGTLSSTVTGALGGWLGRFLVRRPAVA